MSKRPAKRKASTKASANLVQDDDMYPQFFGYIKNNSETDCFLSSFSLAKWCYKAKSSVKEVIKGMCFY